MLDEPISEHVSSGSVGSTLQPTETGTVQAGGANTITLAADAVATDDYYNKQLLKIVDGTGAGQSEYINDYVGSTKVATMGANWAVQPDNTSVYVVEAGGTIPGASAPTATENAQAVWAELLADNDTAGSFGELLGGLFLDFGTAQAGGASSITLASTASATNDIPVYSSIAIISGTGAGQSRQVSDYVGSSKVATVSIPWTTQPDNTSRYIVLPLGVDAATVSAIAAGIWNALRSAHTQAGSFGERVNANVTQISGDTTAADNAEAAFDGTGYNVGNGSIVAASVTGAVGSVTGAVGSITGITFPTNFADLAITVTTGQVTVGTNADKTGYALSATQTFDLTGDITGNLSGSVGSVTGAVGSVTGNVGGNVTGSVGSLAAQAKADVNAEVVDVLTVDTIAELTADPGATPTFAKALALQYMAIRNKRDTTATADEIHNDAGAVVLTAALSDDATTFSKAKYA